MTTAVCTRPDAEVYAVVQEETTARGAYGAKSRTARSLGCSAQHVANVLARYTPPADDLAYVPAPGEAAYEDERKRVCAELRARMAACTDAALLRQLLASTPAVETAQQPPRIMYTPSSDYPLKVPTWKVSPFATLEPHDFHADAKLAADVTLLVAWDVTGLAMLGAMRHWLLGLMLFVFVALPAWHVAASCGRSARRVG